MSGQEFHGRIGRTCDESEPWWPEQTRAREDAPNVLSVALDGSKRYTITFDVDDLPPTTQFWSIPVYDEQGHFVDNERDRYSVNSFTLDAGLLHVEDDELVIYVQHEKPTDPEKAKNWLPAPEGGFRFTPRFYGPRWSLIDGTYDMPGVIPRRE